MPYVEGYGTWPFGEEWLWEAVATCYLPLLDAVRAARRRRSRSRSRRCCATSSRPRGVDGFPSGSRASCATCGATPMRSDVDGCRTAGHERWAAELERAAGDYEWALTRVEALGGDLIGAFKPYASWTSSATHAVLPLLATDAGVRLQLETRHRLAPGALRRRARMGRRLLAARVRARVVARPAAGGRRRPRHLRRPHRRARPRRARAARPDRDRRRPAAGADRPCDDRAGMERRRLPRARRLPRLPRVHRPPPPRLAQRRRDVRLRGGACGKRARTRRTSSRGRSRGSTPAPPPSAAPRLRSARSTPSCWGTGGTRGSRGWRP